MGRLCSWWGTCAGRTRKKGGLALLYQINASLTKPI